MQLLALYLSNLARILQHHGMKYHLEHDFATCIMALSLEGWQGLQGFGGNVHFFKSAKDTMQRISDVGADLISRDQLDLANVSAWGIKQCVLRCLSYEALHYHNS